MLLKVAETVAPVRRKPLAEHLTLILNSDMKPIGYPPMRRNAEDTIKGCYLDRYDVIEWADPASYIIGIHQSYRLPLVVRFKRYHDVSRLHLTPACNLYNLYVRDAGLCQYTGRALSLERHVGEDEEATGDHVLPRARGGKWEWHNMALASFAINNRKGCRTPAEAGLKLLKDPWVPTSEELLYLWLTEDRLAAMPTAWQEHLQVKPTEQVLRVLERAAA